MQAVYSDFERSGGNPHCGTKVKDVVVPLWSENKKNRIVKTSRLDDLKVRCSLTMKTTWKRMMVVTFFAAVIAAHAGHRDWDWSEPRWRVMHQGLDRGELRIEKAAYNLDASLLLSHGCVGFALPSAALPFFEGAGQATVQWRVDGRKTRMGVFVLSPTRRGIDVCAAHTIIKNWEKRFARDILGIDDDAFVAAAPKALTIRLHSPDPRSRNGDIEGSFGLDGVRDMACQYGAVPRKQLRACDGN